MCKSNNTSVGMVRTVALAMLLLLGATPAWAGVVARDGAFITVTPSTIFPPADLSEDSTGPYSGPDHFWYLREVPTASGTTGLTLTSFAVDHVVTAAVTIDAIDDTDISSGTITAEVEVFLLHYDTFGETGHDESPTGSLTFSGEILGVIFLKASLDSSDSTLGLGTVTYPDGVGDPYKTTGDRTMFDDNGGSDQSFTISDSGAGVGLDTFTWLTENPTGAGAKNDIDQVRIIHGPPFTHDTFGDTAPAAVPEPSTWTLLGVAAIGAALRRRRRRRDGAPDEDAA